MDIRLAAIVLFVLLLYFAYKRIRERQRPTVLVNGEGTRVRGWRFDATMAWQDIRQIDVGRFPTVTVERFCVELRGSGENAIAVYDDYRGFETFRAEMFRRWPQIEKGWTEVFTGPPDSGESVTLWKQAGS